jgi:hypothetical protein
MWNNLKLTDRFNFVESEKVVDVVADDPEDRDWTDYEW